MKVNRIDDFGIILQNKWVKMTLKIKIIVHRLTKRRIQQQQQKTRSRPR